MFRPCIDLHEGRVKQIVGGTLSDASQGLQTNFVSDRPSSWYAELYRKDHLFGGHVIMLGPGNESAAREALAAFPGGLQVGGGITATNASTWLDAGASHVIVTSAIFNGPSLDEHRLNELSKKVGASRLVIDLSCRQRDGGYWVVTNRWQTFTDLDLSETCFNRLAPYCDEFLVHAVDVEGLCRGVDLALVEKLIDWTHMPLTYAGGARSLQDLEEVTRLGKGRVHLTIGSAMDIFGGTGIRYEDAVSFNRRLSGKKS